MGRQGRSSVPADRGAESENDLHEEGTGSLNCPNCQSKNTQPVSMAIATGTRRRTTVGASSRSAWTSGSTYRSDFVASLPSRPTNMSAYVFMVAGAFGIFLAVANAEGRTVFACVGIALVLIGLVSKKPAAVLEAAQQTWDRTWVCKRCGHKWVSA